MSQMTLDKISLDSVRSPAFGADLVVRAWEDVALDRIENPPLQFSGRRLTRHWNRLYSGEDLSVSLWQRSTSGYVISFTTWVAGLLRTESVVVESAAEAMCILDGYRAHPPPSVAPADQLIESILHLRMTANFTQVFAALVGEALATWSDLDHPMQQDRLNEKASA